MSSNEDRDFTPEMLSAYLDGELTPSERSTVEEHLAANPEAAKELASLQALRGMLRGLPRESAPTSFSDDLKRRLAASGVTQDPKLAPALKVIPGGKEAADPLDQLAPRRARPMLVAAVLMLVAGVLTVGLPQMLNRTERNQGMTVAENERQLNELADAREAQLRRQAYADLNAEVPANELRPEVLEEDSDAMDDLDQPSATMEGDASSETLAKTLAPLMRASKTVAFDTFSERVSAGSDNLSYQFYSRNPSSLKLEEVSAPQFASLVNSAKDTTDGEVMRARNEETLKTGASRNGSALPAGAAVFDQRGSLAFAATIEGSIEEVAMAMLQLDLDSESLGEVSAAPMPDPKAGPSSNNALGGSGGGSRGNAKPVDDVAEKGTWGNEKKKPSTAVKKQSEKKADKGSTKNDAKSPLKEIAKSEAEEEEAQPLKKAKESADRSRERVRKADAPSEEKGAEPVTESKLEDAEDEARRDNAILRKRNAAPREAAAKPVMQNFALKKLEDLSSADKARLANLIQALRAKGQERVRVVIPLRR